MSNIKYTLNKHKAKIALGASIVFLGATVFGVYSYISNNKTPEKPTGQVYEDTSIKLADYIFTANEQGNVDLIKVSDKTVSQTLNIGEGKTLYARDNDLETIIALNNGTFYELLEDNGLIVKKDICKIENKDINSFKFNDEYITAITDKEIILISLKDNKVDTLKVENVEEYVLHKSTLVYSKDNNIGCINLVDKKEEVIDVGEKTEKMFVINNETVIAYNKFGTGINKYSLFELNPTNLYIEKAHSHDNSTLIPVVSDSDDTMITFIDNLNKNNVDMQSIYTIDLSSEKNNKKRIPIPTTEDYAIQYKDAVSTKGYMYSKNEVGIELFDFRGETIKDTIQTDKTFFMPILK